MRLDEIVAPSVARWGAVPGFVDRWSKQLALIVDRDDLAKAPLDTLAALTLDDLALALAAVLGAHDAVASQRSIIEPLPRTLGRLKLTTEALDDLRQELREKLLVGTTSADRPKLLDYRGRGPLGAWARVMALRAAYDRARTSAHDARRVTNDEDVLGALIDGDDPPDIAQLRARYSVELRAAFRAAALRLDAEERAVLRSHTVDALTVDQMGALYQVHRATAARWVQQAKASLLRALRDELRRRLGDAHGPACESVVALVASRIDLSLDRALLDDPLI